MTLLLLVIAYRDHALEGVRPKWLKPKGMRPHSDELLRSVGIRLEWNEYLNVMVTMEDVDPKKVQKTRPVPKKRGPKPKNAK